MILEECIKTVRFKLGMNQTEFASLIGTSQQCVSNWERGKKNPSFRNIQKIISALNNQEGDLKVTNLLSSIQI